VLSLRARAPIIPVFVIRELPWRFRFYIEQAIWPPQGPAADDRVLQLTQTYATIMERYLRRFPSQWLMFHPLFGEPRARSGQAGDTTHHAG
jgi:lauroyl/myristoyl acyltransferase